MPYNDDEKISEFNSAALKMKRLNKMEDNINDVSNNLWAINPMYGIYNFEVKLHHCNQLYQEVVPMLTPAEEQEGLALKEAIEQMIRKNPPIKIIRDGNGTIKFDKNMQIVIAEWLFKYDTMIRKLKSKHGMDTNFNEDSGLIL